MRTYVNLAALAMFAAIGAAAPARAGSYSVLWQFKDSASGAEPAASLLSIGSVLYGTTVTGGSNNGGVVFSFYPATGAEAVLYNFNFRSSTSSFPTTNLISVHGTLYGTTHGEGLLDCQSPYCGAVFSVDSITKAENTVYSFEGGKDGSTVDAALINVGGTLYGATAQGGATHVGTVFAINRSTDAERVLYSFRADGSGTGPKSNLIYRKGMLYGTTQHGGGGSCLGGCGTVFALNPKTGVETVIHPFVGGSDGDAPMAGLINEGEMLYGTTRLGGTGQCPPGCGTVFSVNLKTGVESILHSFAGKQDGVGPIAGVIDVGGTLYGTTEYGGDAGYGTVFALKLKTGHKTILHSFQSVTDGANPQAGLIEVGGTLYGTTFSGGYGDAGTIFAYTP